MVRVIHLADCGAHIAIATDILAVAAGYHHRQFGSGQMVGDRAFLVDYYCGADIRGVYWVAFCARKYAAFNRGTADPFGVQPAPNLHSLPVAFDGTARRIGQLE